jgi:hypothetical protein
MRKNGEFCRWGRPIQLSSVPQAVFEVSFFDHLIDGEGQGFSRGGRIFDQEFARLALLSAPS